MKHGSSCSCGICRLGKKLGIIKADNMQSSTEEKKFACTHCGSESKDMPGMCCGGERKEK